jgi:hypothetical protein
MIARINGSRDTVFPIVTDLTDNQPRRRAAYSSVAGRNIFG